MLLLATTSLIMAAATPHQSWRVSPDGFGPLRVGMTVEQGERALGGEMTIVEDVAYDCKHATFKRLPDGVRIMVIDGKILARVEVAKAGVLTREGVGVGSTEAQVLARYRGKIRTKPHQYDPKGHYLAYFAEGSGRGIVFETDGKRVVMVRAGRRPEVEYIEGCI